MSDKPRFLLCEDGREYIERFERFLGDRSEFIQSQDFAALLDHYAQHQPVAGILLDLDFRRTETSRLIDGEGRGLSPANAAERVRIAANQGIAILAGLRRAGIKVSVLLFADIEDSRQREFLEQRYAPLQIIDSRVGLDELQRRFEALGRNAGK